MVSTTSAGVQLPYGTFAPSISSDGKWVAFSHGDGQIWRKNLLNGRLDLVSSTSSGQPGDDYSDFPTISSSGRYVAFFSTSANLVPNDRDSRGRTHEQDVFVKDMSSGNVMIASVNSQGESANGPSGDIPINYYDSTVTDVSANGRYVAFTSSASNLVSGDTNGRPDVFVRDFLNGTTSRVSVPTPSLLPLPQKTVWGGGSNSASMSADGRFIAFTSESILAGNDVNGGSDVYLHDRQDSTTTLISRIPGSANSYEAWVPAISDDGQHVAFERKENNGYAVHVHDVQGQTDTLIASQSWSPALSGDGSVVTYTKKTSSGLGLYLQDRAAGTEIRIDRGCFGTEPNRPTRNDYRDDTMAADGDRVVWYSDATNIVGGDLTAWNRDIFVWDRSASAAENPQCALETKAMATTQTWGRGLHSAGCSVCRGDPINTATGNYTESMTDLTMPGIGIPFRFTRSYNSADDTAGELGRGWTHRYAASLTVEPDGNIRFRAEDGSQIMFASTESGSYIAAPGARSRLISTPTGYELTSRSQLKYGFDAGGRLVALSDRNGNQIDLAYSAGLLTTLTDTAGRVVTFGHDAQGNLTSATLPDGRALTFGYTGGLLTSATDPRGKQRTYTYDTDGRLINMHDEDGERVVQNVYGSDGRVAAQTDARGQITTFAWDQETQTSKVTDPRGNVWTEVYLNNLLQRQIDPLNNVRQFSYDDDLNIRKVVDERGHATSMTYDQRGNLLTRISPPPLSYMEEWTYNSTDDVTSSTDGRGGVTSYSYDPAGNLVAVVLPGNLSTTFERDPTTGLVTSVTDARQKTTSYSYDSQGNLTALTLPSGAQTTFGYDATGRLTTVVDPRGNAPTSNPNDFTWSHSWNANDQLTSVTDPVENQTSYSYDDVGHSATTSDANGRTTSYSYNAAGDLVSVAAPDLSVTSYDHDEMGNLVARTDANDHVTTYSYDQVGRLVSATTPAGRVRTYAYDEIGNLTRETTARGNATSDPGDGTISFDYDSLNRLVALDFSDQTPDVSYDYDPNGNRTAMNDGFGTVTYAYDDLDRLTQVTRGTASFTYTYDPVGHVTSRLYPDGTQTGYTYDNDGQMSSAVSAGRTTTYAYDEAGHPTRVELPNGHVEETTYDPAGRLSKVENLRSGVPVTSFSYERDPVGNPTSIVSPTTSTYYTYDALDRLTKECAPESCSQPSTDKQEYAYDDVGNRVSRVSSGGTTTYAYNADDEMVSADRPLGSTDYTYDADGNMLTAGTRSYAYDLAGRTTSSSDLALTTSYTYDGDGNRLTLDGGTDRLRFAWDVNYALPQLATESHNVTNANLRSYIYGLQRISMNDSDGAPHFYSYDGLGSVIEMSALNGDQEWSYSYDAFGEAKSTEKVALLAPPNPMRFTGEYLDPTGLYHLRARQYDPSLGRFTATDPVSPAIHDPYVSAYAYVNNQPTVYVDPSGLIQEAMAGGGGPPIALPLTSETAALVGKGLIRAGLGALSALAGQGAATLGETWPCDGWARGAYARDLERNPGPDELNKIVRRQQRPVEEGGNQFGRRSEWCRRNRAACTAIIGTTVGAVGVHELGPGGPTP